VEASWILEHFEHGSYRLPSEIVFADGTYSLDVAYPRRIEPSGFALAAVAYASLGNSSLLDDPLKSALCQLIENDASSLLPLMRDLQLASDALGSILRRDGYAGWLRVLTPELSARFAPEVLRAQASAAIEGIQSRSAGLSEWMAVHTILHDHPAPATLSGGLRAGILAIDLVQLRVTNAHAALIAATFASQHAGRLGQDVVTHVRQQLLSLAAAIAEERGRSPEEVESVQQVLLSAAFYLYGHPVATEGESRFFWIGGLLSDLVDRCPGLVEGCQYLVDRLVDGLPNADSRWLWRLQVQLRARR
jgi:hypothetical protein